MLTIENLLNWFVGNKFSGKVRGDSNSRFFLHPQKKLTKKVRLFQHSVSVSQFFLQSDQSAELPRSVFGLILKLAFFDEKCQYFMAMCLRFALNC